LVGALFKAAWHFYMTEITRSHFVLGLIGLVFGLTIFVVSLFSANQLYSTRTSSASCRSFYWGEQVLPDHIFYPVLVGMDRLLLIIARGDEEIKLKIDYGHLRWEMAQALQAKGKTEMAVSTLTKSQKYFHQVAQQVLVENSSEKMKKYVSRNLSFNIQQAQQLAKSFNDEQRSVIDELNAQNLVLLKELRSQF